MPEDVTLFRRDYHLWSTNSIVTGATEVEFFNLISGSKMADDSTTVRPGHTNLLEANKLPKGYDMRVEGMAILYEEDSDIVDIRALRKYAQLELKTQKQEWGTFYPRLIGGGVPTVLEGQTNFENVRTGGGQISALYPFAEPLILKDQEIFKVLWKYDSNLKPTLNATQFVTIVFVGQLTQPGASN